MNGAPMGKVSAQKVSAEHWDVRHGQQRLSAHVLSMMTHGSMLLMLSMLPMLSCCLRGLLLLSCCASRVK